MPTPPTDPAPHSYLPTCDFPPPGTAVNCAFSGGTDSTALIVLARAAGCVVTAHHVDHGLRASSPNEAAHAHTIATTLGAHFIGHTLNIVGTHNLEARARAARHDVLPHGTLTGHTADDQAETVLLRLMRGAATSGLGAMTPHPTRPILALRRHDTEAICRAAGVDPVRDPTNDQPIFWRNRVRHEVLPLLADITDRDPVPILNRTAALLRDEDHYLDQLASNIDPTDARALASAPVVLARRALRRWLTHQGYPPSARCIERVLSVARGETIGCEIDGGRRIERSRQQLRLAAPSR